VLDFRRTWDIARPHGEREPDAANPPWLHPGKYDSALTAFPVLGQRLNQMAGSLSGGDQQMLTLARGYLSGPGVVLLDEVSMGLAPLVVEHIFQSIGQLASEGMALLLVEQYVNRALEMADKVYLIQRGRISYEGSPENLDQAAVMRSYVGSDLNRSGSNPYESKSPESEGD
jgi:branched-chain amino acid transport system ATP-binding protein